MKEAERAESRPPAESGLRAVVHGRVQGVSFRYYAQRRAGELGLTGYVRNLWDGSVEVLAEGSRADLEEFLAFLRVGPRSAFVSQVDTQWSPATNAFERFEVRH
jgi:acylphosphatase